MRVGPLAVTYVAGSRRDVMAMGRKVGRGEAGMVSLVALYTSVSGLWADCWPCLQSDTHSHRNGTVLVLHMRLADSHGGLARRVFHTCLLECDLRDCPCQPGPPQEPGGHSRGNTATRVS
jgi:hypothetical protein